VIFPTKLDSPQSEFICKSYRVSRTRVSGIPSESENSGLIPSQSESIRNGPEYSGCPEVSGRIPGGFRTRVENFCWVFGMARNDSEYSERPEYSGSIPDGFRTKGEYFCWVFGMSRNIPVVRNIPNHSGSIPDGAKNYITVRFRGGLFKGSSSPK